MDRMSSVHTQHVDMCPYGHDGRWFPWKELFFIPQTKIRIIINRGNHCDGCQSQKGHVGFFGDINKYPDTSPHLLEFKKSNCMN